MKTMKSLAFGLATLLLSALVQAQEFKIGVVNTDQILREANIAKTAQTKLDGEFSKREKDLSDVGKTLQSAFEKFEREAPTLSETQRGARQRQLAEQERDFQRKRREFQEDLNLRRNEETQGLIERTSRAVRQVAEAEKYDVVLQEAVYVNPKHDITEKVLRALNAQPR